MTPTKEAFDAAIKMAKAVKAYETQVRYFPEVWEKIMEAKKEFDTKAVLVKEYERMMNIGSSEN